MNISSVLLTDFYKQCHAEQYDPTITKLVSYYTPRMSRLRGVDSVPVVGLQAFIIEYLIDHFNKNFFERNLTDVMEEYEFIITKTMGANRVNSEKIEKLHRLQYLPIEIRALDEGLMCPIKCPMIEISNTHDDFAWCTNLIESLMSSELWYQGCTAIAGIMYRKIVNKYYEQTSDNLQLRKSAISEFGFRGLPGLGAAIKASTGFLLSFNKTATIPSIYYIARYYGDLIENIATGMASTEHSVMCSSYSLDGDEITQIERLLSEVYPDGNFSMVSDSYDYWNVIKNLLPKAKESILSRNGTLFVRGDSGDPVEIVTKTVSELYSIFGGSINSKGYAVLNSKIRVIYGDSITPLRARKIYHILEQNGFSAENVALGAGSFSMLCLEEEYKEGEDVCTRLQPYTRDTFGVAIKSTYGEYKFNKMDSKASNPFVISKNPKTDSLHFKKSQVGACAVFNTKNGIVYTDGVNLNKAHKDLDNLLTPVYKNGKMLRITSFADIRNRLWNNDF